MIGSRMEPAIPVRSVYVDGTWDGREEVLEVPGGIPTIVPVDAPLAYCVRADLMPDGCWRMAWRGFEVSAEEGGSAIIAAPRAPHGALRSRDGTRTGRPTQETRA